ncbi:MAG: hypothetical protein NZ529_02615 [Cytophagaceae bacterium]|nr:hypothetical protein [Cytophagaceae bacterium]MDW8455663.1 hypothetical protein [Cytophagaceae bacterium]
MKNTMILIVCVLIMIFMSDANAQCAMCKATSESGGFSPAGLNKGILYLMSIPYIAFAVILYFWWKQSKKTREQQKKLLSMLKDNTEK